MMQYHTLQNNPQIQTPRTEIVLAMTVQHEMQDSENMWQICINVYARDANEKQVVNNNKNMWASDSFFDISKH